jgi:outer membrane protein OmpA-like peptidoglycan-associated protein
MPSSPRALIFLCLVSVLSASCSRGVVHPVNTGREYGDKVPIMVSHIGKGSRHYILQDILCFDYMCRTQAGKKKAMRQISFDDYKKRLRKNAKKGLYQNLSPPRKAQPKPDSIKIPKDTMITAAVVPKPTTVAPAPPMLERDSLITLGDLLFEYNSDKLQNDHISPLESLAAFLHARPNILVEVTGHTDNTGAERHNVALSTRRAQVVMEYLVDHGAVFERITFEGFGSSRPVADNKTAQGRQKNRRVEVRLSEPK